MIIFKSVKWKNFLSTGNAWTEIILDKTNNTIIIGENGSGKSTVLDALCFGLFGKPFRKINKPQLVNSVNEKSLEVIIEFVNGGNEYKVIRGMKPNKFEIYCNEMMLDQTASVKDYQENFEKNIVKLSYHAFTQIVILGSSTFVPFMQLPSQQRREIIEDLLDIKIFTAMNILLKEKLNNNRDEIQEVKNAINLENEKLKVHTKYIAELEAAATKRKDNIEAKLKENKNKLAKIGNTGVEITTQVTALNATIDDVTEVRNSLNDIGTNLNSLNQEIKTTKKKMSFYENNDVCPTCESPISKEIKTKYIDEYQKEIEDIHSNISELKRLNEENTKRSNEIVAVEIEIDNLTNKLLKLKQDAKLLNTVIKSLETDLKEHTSEHNLDEENKTVNEIKKLIKSLDKEQEKYLHEKELLDIAQELLKDKGIKTQIVRQYIPIMNKLINKYLAAMEFFVNFELDDNFDELIKSRHRDEFSYASFSEGEKMRIDLALLLTWRSIAKMKNSTNTNLLILDEVFDASLDSNGCDEFMKLLEELGKNTNIFVISHKGDSLQDKFRSVIRFEKHKNFSRMI